VFVKLHPININVAARLDEVAGLLKEQEEEGFRVNAYRRAAETIRRLDRPVDEIVRDEGIDGLLSLPGIGQSLARSIHQLVVTGGLPLLEHRAGASAPQDKRLGRDLLRWRPRRAAMHSDHG
jgi:DNA polymerase/3'-5' exonuclease PolX